MHKIHHYLKKITKHFTSFTLNTPTAILLGAVIIAISILGYGFVTSNNSDSAIVSNPLPKILKNLGINKKDFIACVDSKETAAYVAASTEDGVQAGVSGTPSTFIVREEAGVPYVVTMVSGAQSDSYFRQAIDQALALTSVNKLARFTGKAVDANDLQEVSTPSKVYVIEYSDAECPFCISLHNTMKQIRTDYAGKISFIYRSFPLPFHQHAQKEASMIACAGRLGGAKSYYGFIDSTFDFKIKNNVGFIALDNQ